MQTLHGNPYGGRLAALRAALGLAWRRPLLFLLVTLVSALVLAAAGLAAAAAWRLSPFAAPSWMQAQALVVAAGGEGEVDLGTLRTALRAAVQPPELVLSIDFVGRDAALRELAQRKDLAGIDLAALRPNPLPDSFQVHFAPGATPEQVEAAAAALRRVRNVDTVVYQPEPLRRAWQLARLGRQLVVLVACVLAASVFAVAMLAVTAWARVDPQEMRVLHLLGADPGAGLRPAAYATGLSLLASALLAWWASVMAGAWLDPSLADLAQRYSIGWRQEPVPPWLPALACAGAALLGAFAAALALRLSARRGPRHAS